MIAVKLNCIRRLLLGLSLAGALVSHGTVFFQNNGTQEGWPTQGQLPQAKGTISDVTSPAFQGNNAIKFTQTWIPNYTGRYHSEVHYQGTQFTGQTRYYGMTVFLASDWDLADSKVSIQQWAGTGPWIIMEVRGSNLVILPHIAAITTIAPITRGVWMRIVTQITDASSGTLAVWVNGTQKLHLTGNLVAPAPNGEIRWSCGEYVTGWTGVTTQPSPSYRELFEDHFRIADTEAEAEPANWNEPSGPTQTAAPSFSPAPGTYSSAQSVTISDATSGASIRYTTDGSTPSETAGTLYTGTPVSISSTTVLSAIAYASGSTDSNITSGTYTITVINPPAAAPVFSPGAGTYSTAQNVTITSATGTASIRYTTDGSTPSETAGTLYSGPVNIAKTATLKAIAYAAGFSDSTVTSGAYTIGSPVTLNFEAESLSYTGSGATTSVQTDTNSSGGKWVELAGNSVGDNITFTVPNVPAGTYQLKMEWKGNANRGRLQLAVDGTNLGSVLDQYAAGQTYPTTTFGNVTFSAAGNHTVKLTVTGKNSASSGYILSADKFTFTGQ
ncbi:MAG TPA: chitobiase/beta-hexosaminidase C-terminal domain-containing protein [Opitutaceae bacterium]|nr:chitobiase/beta-hexosaminidase C-terminal domain-containing protein [Opitutaceae bacterium]